MVFVWNPKLVEIVRVRDLQFVDAYICANVRHLGESKYRAAEHAFAQSV